MMMISTNKHMRHNTQTHSFRMLGMSYLFVTRIIIIISIIIIMMIITIIVIIIVIIICLFV